MTFDDWYETLAYDEQNTLSSYDVWVGAIETAISSLRLKREMFIRKEKKEHAKGILAAILLLKEKLDPAINRNLK